MTLEPSSLLPATCCMSLAAVIGLLASGRTLEAGLTAAVCFLCVVGLGASAEEARKEMREKARLETWSSRRRHPVETGMV